MSRDELHAIAQADTPEGVQVPNTMPGLIAWGFMRFGTNAMIMMICLGVGGYALKGIYADLGRSNMIVLEMVRAQTTSNTRLESTLAELARQVENNTRAITDLQRTTTRNQ
ncbi:hypothetical protein JIN84_13030 [Luteolibacter yonseiensis]|uniref:Uncharacterized protein n=1 Tax=Luteolibacter yonseiensis TaxID=1144680 RepID=A0A934R1A6_9BACT|nr:hypothetical protein [Luteolibacter yonseiensis]MBK1816543.1 hypothetical protein [Luteolibacter yonseiensis]